MENRRRHQSIFQPRSKCAEMAAHSRQAEFTGASLVELLRLRAAVQPREVAYTFLRDGEHEADVMTYEALDRLSRAIAVRLQLWCRPGDRALLLYPPGLEFISAFFGCLYAQVVAVPTYPPNLTRADRAAPRLRAIAADARPLAVLSTRELMDALTDASETFSASRHVEWIATNEIDHEEACEWRDPGVDRTTLALLQYTSGSTSTPRGVMITHGNLLHNLAYAFHLGEDGSSSVSVSWLPVIHDMGLIEGVLQPAFSGGPAYLMSPAAFLQRPVRWLNAISRYGATRSGGPNFAYDLCVRRIGAEERHSLDLTTWRSAYCGAEPIRHDTLRAFASAFAPGGFRSSALRPCFGLAEATLLVTAGTWTGAGSDARTAPAAARNDEAVDLPRVSCGTAGLDTRVVIVEPETRRPCGPGTVGEIWVAGPSVAQGYWDRAEETASTFRALTDGGEGPFLRTGDLGFVDEGDLYVSGRLKDVLIVRGMKHYPQDLEQTTEQHPAIRPGCSAAFVTEAGSLGDRIAIVAEADVRQLTTPESAEAAITMIRRSIAELHGVLLEAVVLVAPGAIPKTTSGKLQRFACRDAFLSDRLSVLAAWRGSSAEGERCA
jgi:acyl-CoA synthetase (AMP-forming)/AMP-acid ligase II